MSKNVKDEIDEAISYLLTITPRLDGCCRNKLIAKLEETNEKWICPSCSYFLKELVKVLKDVESEKEKD